MATRFLLMILFLAAVMPVSQAETKKTTIYDDGASCPANCDAHVVFHKDMNGTEFAYKPGTKNVPCERNQTCRICLESGGKQCLEVMYRGRGPHPDTFDFTPAFYKEACATTPEQSLLAKECKELKNAAKQLEGRINCIAIPDNTKCVDIIAASKTARELDLPKYNLCLQMGEKNYNKNKSVAEKRSNECAYEFKGTGKSPKKIWRKLLPGTCRVQTYVGRDGLDCCSGITFADGPLGVECQGFYPQP